MSLILDALNRADQERSADNNTPSLQTSHSSMVEQSRPLRRWIIEAVIILIALVAFGYSQWGPQQQSAPVKPIETAPEKIVTEPPLIATAVLPSAPQTVEADKPDTTASETVNTSAPSAAKQVNSAIAYLYQQPVNNAVTKAAPPSTPKIEPSAQNSATTQQVANSPAADPITAAALILQQIPLITERSSRFQRALPNIEYSVHMHAEAQGRGFVILNGKTQKVGAEVLPGLRVIAILKGSVVLAYNGSQFRLSALNSWINYN